MEYIMIRKHGQHISSYTDFDDSTQKSATAANSIIEKYNKNKSCCKIASALNFVSTKYDDAIEYTGISNHIRGLVMLIGLLVLFAGCQAAARVYDYLTYSEPGYFGAFTLSIGAVLAFMLFIWTMRFELFRPIDEPIVFDRKNRKIYRLFREVEPGFLGLTEHWPMCIAEYEWDSTEMWHTASLVTQGSNVVRYHHLRVIVRSSEDGSVIDQFTIGNSMELGEQTVPIFWEHIRRFMEEKGPHLPPTEQLCRPRKESTLWASLGAVGPFGAGYVNWWKKHPILMTFFHLISPVLLPFNVAWGLCHWLSYQTAFPVEWPQEILDKIGRPHPPA